MTRILEILGRMFGGAMLCVFAFAPAWVGFNILAQVIVHPSELDLAAIAAMGVCFALLYFLLLLAYRAFTGTGRKADGGLLPPWAMKLFAATFGVTAILIVFYGIYTAQLRAVLGGLGYLVTALSVYGVVRWRQTQHRFDA